MRGGLLALWGCIAAMSVRGQIDQALAAHLIAPSFETPAISKAHLLVTRAASIGLVWFAQEAPGARGFGTFAFVVHTRLLHPLHETIDHLFLPGFFERDGEFVAVDLHHLAVAEFLVEHAVGQGKFRNGAGGFRDQLAFDDHRAALVARA